MEKYQGASASFWEQAMTGRGEHGLPVEVLLTGVQPQQGTAYVR